MTLVRITTCAILLAGLAAGRSQAASETVVYTFGPYSASSEPASGRNPDGGLRSMFGRTFYGTADQGGLLASGASAAGTLYRIARAPGGGAGFMLLHSFDPATEGSTPEGIPATDNLSLYGTLQTGPGTGSGSVYQWTPATDEHHPGKLTLLHVFGGTGDGKLPTGTLLRAFDGTLYGTTSFDSTAFNGLVFSLTPPAAGQSAWTYSILHVFNGQDGSQPQGGLVQDASGTLYGATILGGPAGKGTVFSLKPPARGESVWTETTLAGFEAAGAPSEPNTPLLLDPDGAIFATSYVGGSSDRGTVFKLSPPALAGAGWTTSVLLSFTGPNGSEPMAPLIENAQGIFYGTTSSGGAHDRGIVFSFARPADGGADGQETDLIDFLSGTAPRGARPTGGLALTANGELAGTTPTSGLNDTGVIYLVKP